MGKVRKRKKNKFQSKSLNNSSVNNRPSSSANNNADVSCTSDTIITSNETSTTSNDKMNLDQLFETEIQKAICEDPILDTDLHEQMKTKLEPFLEQLDCSMRTFCELKLSNNANLFKVN